MKIFVLGNFMNAHFVHVERLPLPGESLAARRVFQELGGKGLNLGVGLHRLGAEVAMLMGVGRDAPGRAVTQALAEEGMRTEGFLPLADHSGFGVGFISPCGSNFLASHLGANALLSEIHVDAACEDIRDALWVLAQFELPDAPILAAFRMAREHGAETYLNPSPWRAIPDEIFALTDVLVVNETEAALLFDLPANETQPDWVGQLFDFAASTGWQGRLLVVTLGDKGSIALDSSGEVLFEAAYRVDQIDATGAGDAFGAGLVFSLMRGSDVRAALRFANTCGAIIAAREGILAHLPTLGEVGSFGEE
jgi:ribokinase